MGLDALGLLCDPGLGVHVAPRQSAATTKALRDERGLIVAPESRVISHDLLDPDQIDAKAVNRVDRPFEVVGTSPALPFVNIERGNAERRSGVRRCRNRAD